MLIITTIYSRRLPIPDLTVLVPLTGLIGLQAMTGYKNSDEPETVIPGL